MLIWSCVFTANWPKSYFLQNPYFNSLIQTLTLTESKQVVRWVLSFSGPDLTKVADHTQQRSPPDAHLVLPYACTKAPQAHHSGPQEGLKSGGACSNVEGTICPSGLANMPRSGGALASQAPMVRFPATLYPHVRFKNRAAKSNPQTLNC